ncbi:hypothetical protein OOZ19_16000 [Saccharopolyspora sp. NFXS83]|uniref:hypothetical protein n=1 Tax=Saccharopolyspora sp. NFXS83 TaxID=2993560 RepID=UPI00224B7AEC|nr:hypothetical protein [Saccharopolyspora sp. NFXS83]MCX2731745.1 hypothetical protein [Saccharopolyspora sp. NFXS83]
MRSSVITDEVTGPVLARGGPAGLRVDELLAVMAEQAAAVAAVRSKWAESVRAVPPAPDDAEPTESDVAPLNDMRRDLWFKSEGVREMWFSNYVLWVGWWVDTAQLALEAAAGEPDTELWRVAATSPSRTPRGRGSDSVDPLWPVRRARLRCWGENWINDSLPRLLERDELDRVLALTGGTSSAHAVRLAHRSVLRAQCAGDLALDQEESNSAAPSEVNRNWNRYSSRHQLVCVYAQAIADHLGQWWGAAEFVDGCDRAP